MTNQKRRNAEALFFEGNRHMEAGEVARAEACLRKAVRMVPDFAEAHANLGLLLERQGATDAAEECYRQSLGFDPSNSQTHLNLGALLTKQKRFSEAEAAYKQAIALKIGRASCRERG